MKQQSINSKGFERALCVLAGIALALMVVYMLVIISFKDQLATINDLDAQSNITLNGTWADLYPRGATVEQLYNATSISLAK